MGQKINFQLRFSVWKFKDFLKISNLIGFSSNAQKFPASFLSSFRIIPDF